MECTMTRFPNPRALVRELGDHDDRQLMDIGLVRAGDGSLRLADDPSMDALTKVDRPFVGHPLAALSETLRSLIRAARAVPFHSSASGPVILTEEIAA
jgi:hypothetical protein